MKLTPEQLGDWFYTANPHFGDDAYARWLEFLKNPTDGLTRSEVVLGMKQGINDTLAMAEGWNYKKWKEVSDALAAKGLPSIEKMELRMKQKHRRILKRGAINNDEEFYLVAEILSDLTLDVSDEEPSGSRCDEHRLRSNEDRMRSFQTASSPLRPNPVGHRSAPRGLPA